MRDPAPPSPLPVLTDPALPEAGAWVALPLAMLRRLPAVRQGGRVDYLGLPEQLAAQCQPPPRMTLSLAYVPAGALPATLGHPLAAPAVTVNLPGCIRRLLALPPLEARVVRFGFLGARLTLLDGQEGQVVGTLHQGRPAALRIALGNAMGNAMGDALLDLPLHAFAHRVRHWEGPPGPVRSEDGT
ncbi:hypothetical protein NON00_17435 [Roseomonas sp. GC11]|uniref:hypothetical protein n=1 Tax=Roseomonas sp. GC11 TaxID=2950546 RepID=UPI002108BD3A|nr:hypothetical protein [Roseomonas sp. GC11]MCQ4161700.1 hypothetical protein [Roseomonas sp. GC11]